jgi:crotonobetainyl-CoA:carnitine CoA-transferase CaiB-like acyl-CoA transferase
VGLGPMDGIRVLELANFVAAPSGSALMADLGADVIKIEPPGGDGWRYRLAGGGMLPQFNHDNRGKRSVVLDITAPAGAEAARRLIGAADVLLTNLLPERRRRLGFDPELLLGRFPRLIYVGVTGYGPDGPDADRPGFDYSAFWASSGVMGKLVQPDEPPPLARGAIGDHTTGISNLAATLAALRLRDRTGRGQVVELSLFSVGQWFNSTDIVNAAVTGAEPVVHDRRRPFNPLWNTYQCGDGLWLMLTMLQPDLYWARFCRAMRHAEWLEQAEWAAAPARAVDSEHLTATIGEEFARASRSEWGGRLDQEGIIFAPVSTVLEVVGRPQTAAQRILQIPEGSELPVVRAPFEIRGADIRPRGPAPELGQQTEEVLLEAGLDWEAIAALRAQGAFGA